MAARQRRLPLRGCAARMPSWLPRLRQPRSCWPRQRRRKRRRRSSLHSAQCARPFQQERSHSRLRLWPSDQLTESATCFCPQHTGHLACSMQLTPSAYPHSLTHVQLLAGLRRCWEAQPADPVAWLGEWLAQRAATSTGSTAASHAGVSARSVTAARSHGMVFHGNISRGSSLTASCSCCGTGHAAAY